MFDPISLTAGAAILLTGYLAGRAHRRKQPTVPVCGCTHGRNYHDEHGRCHWTSMRALATGGMRRDELVQCSCQRYVGPELLADLWAPPILPPAP